MRNTTTRKIFIVALWLFLIANTIYWISKWSYDTGVKNGRDNLVAHLNQPELRISHLYRDSIHFIVIEQRMRTGDLVSQRVEVDTNSMDGLDARRVGATGSGRFGSIDEVALWMIVNNSDQDLHLTENEFTNLPDTFRLTKNFDDTFKIPTQK